MAKIAYRQCELQKQNNGSVIRQVAYIPEIYASIGRVVRIRENTIWTDGWKVTKAHHDVVYDDDLPDWHQSIKNHRKATGDSLKK